MSIESQSESGVRTVPHSSRAAVVAVGSLFATNGLVIGGWAGCLPALRGADREDESRRARDLVLPGLPALNDYELYAASRSSSQPLLSSRQSSV